MQCRRGRFHFSHSLPLFRYSRRVTSGSSLEPTIIFHNIPFASRREYSTSGRILLSVKRCEIEEDNARANGDVAPQKKEGLQSSFRLQLDRCASSTAAASRRREAPLAPQTTNASPPRPPLIMSTQLEKIIAQYLWDGQGGYAFETWWDAYRLSLKYNACPSRSGKRIGHVNRSPPTFSSALIIQLAIYALFVKNQPRLAGDLLPLLDLQSGSGLATTIVRRTRGGEMNKDHKDRSLSWHFDNPLNETSMYCIVSEWLHCECRLAYLRGLPNNWTGQTEKLIAEHRVSEANLSNITNDSGICLSNKNNLPKTETEEIQNQDVLTACGAVLETLVKWLLQELVYFKLSKGVSACESDTSPSRSSAFLETAPFATAPLAMPPQCPASVLIVFLLVQSVCNFLWKTISNEKGGDAKSKSSRVGRASVLSEQIIQSYAPRSYSTEAWKMLVEGVLLPSVEIVTWKTLSCTLSEQDTENICLRTSSSVSCWLETEGSVEETIEKCHVRLEETLSNSLFSKPPFSPLCSLPNALLLVPHATKAWLVACADGGKGQNPSRMNNTRPRDARHLAFPHKSSDVVWDRGKKDRLHLYRALVHSLWPFLECEVSVRASLFPSAVPRRPSAESPQATLSDVNRLIDAGDWAAALGLVPRVLANPRQAARKALTACEAARPDPSVAWRGALAVWKRYYEDYDKCDKYDKSNSSSRAGPSREAWSGTKPRSEPRARTPLGWREIGRLLTLLARAQRWREALAIYRRLGAEQLDGYVFRQVAYALSSTRRRELNGLVVELWADWRCRVGDEARPTASMLEQFLVAGLHGDDAAAACACALVKESLSQTQRDPAAIVPGSELPLDFAKNEVVLQRLLRDRWYSESWKSALALAITSRRPGLIEAVALKSPPNIAVLTSVLESSPLSTTGLQMRNLEKGDNFMEGRGHESKDLTMAVRMALASHAVMTKHSWSISNAHDTKESATTIPKIDPSVGHSPRSRMNPQRHEGQFIERVLDGLLGGSEKNNIRKSDVKKNHTQSSD